MQLKETDVLIIGAGILGLAIARELITRFPQKKILLIEKEPHVAEHASGRNSGVLHAGFYYGADSLKAKFCRDGNAALKTYARENGLHLNECGKVVVALDEEQREGLHTLKSRGDANGVVTRIINENELAAIEPNARTFKEALYSPTTAVVDPLEICTALAGELKERGVELLFSCRYMRRKGDIVEAGNLRIRAQQVFNCAGLYADKIARDFGFCKGYTIIPFKGVYLTYQGAGQPVRCCVYPVPDMKNPFLGVHFGLRFDGQARIGPTAIPALWRENYHGFSQFNIDELLAIGIWELKLLLTNAAFRSLAMAEIKKYDRRTLMESAGRMVKNIDMKQFSAWSRPGIRAQLVDMRRSTLVQDFIVEGDGASVHVLNAVSPAFTSSLPFAKWVVEKYT